MLLLLLVTTVLLLLLAGVYILDSDHQMKGTTRRLLCSKQLARTLAVAQWIAVQ